MAYFKKSPYNPKLSSPQNKNLKNRSESTSNIFDKLFKDHEEYNIKKDQMKISFEKS